MRICYIPLLFACRRLMRAEEFSKNILDLDDKMRFAGILEKSGHLHARCKKEGCEEYLNIKNRGISFSQIAHIIEMRKNFSSDLGDLKYIVYSYDKAKIFSIPLTDHIVVFSTLVPRTNFLAICIRSRLNSTGRIRYTTRSLFLLSSLSFFCPRSIVRASQYQEKC
jgi:hypothetical protein